MGASCAVNASALVLAADVPFSGTIGVITRTSAPSVRFIRIASVPVDLGHVFIGDAAPVRLIPIDNELPVLPRWQ
jgi:hypothetical protein